MERRKCREDHRDDMKCRLVQVGRLSHREHVHTEPCGEIEDAEVDKIKKRESSSLMMTMPLISKLTAA